MKLLGTRAALFGILQAPSMVAGILEAMAPLARFSNK
jgi:hypothetical protein